MLHKKLKPKKVKRIAKTKTLRQDVFVSDTPPLWSQSHSLCTTHFSVPVGIHNKKMK
jgi:hypothetical protein